MVRATHEFAILLFSKFYSQGIMTIVLSISSVIQFSHGILFMDLPLLIAWKTLMAVASVAIHISKN